MEQGGPRPTDQRICRPIQEPTEGFIDRRNSPAGIEAKGELMAFQCRQHRVHAGELSTVVDETAATQAKSATITAEEAVTVNGKQILLG